MYKNKSYYDSYMRESLSADTSLEKMSIQYCRDSLFW